MVDVSKYPYFSYDDLLEPLLEPISSQANVKLNSFRRWYNPREQILIIPKWMESCTLAYFAKELYKTSYCAHDLKNVTSRFIMCDHFPPIANQPIYKFVQEESKSAHILMVFQNHEFFLDLFLFSSIPQDDMVNNFYLNRKELFTTYIQEFYQVMAHVLDNLSHHRLTVPFTPQALTESPEKRITRQMECGELVAKGLTAKEIGRQLQLSPRTVEFYIDLLRKKTGAKNRSHLIYLLGDSRRSRSHII